MSHAATLSPVDATGIRTLTLDRPAKANTLSADLVETLLSLVAAAARDDTQVLVIRAAGKNFCAGFDLGQTSEQSDGDLVRRFVRIEELLQALRHARSLTIACAQGAAYGAGADLVAACTFRVGTPATRLRFPGFQFGVALGTRHLAGIVGVAHARALLLDNALLDADQALACGLLTDVVEPADFDSTIARLATGARRLNRDTLNALLINTADDSRDRDLAALVRSISAPGLRERIEKYKETFAAPAP
ncbi:MAG: enoyl-CoA hydratase/isomerase family protein [Betaproteobacteria bacterium]